MRAISAISLGLVLGTTLLASTAGATVTFRAGDYSRTVFTGPGPDPGQVAFTDAGHLPLVSYAPPTSFLGRAVTYDISYTATGVQSFTAAGQPSRVDYTSLTYTFDALVGHPRFVRDAAGNVLVQNAAPLPLRLGSGSLLSGSFVFGPHPSGYELRGPLDATFTPTALGLAVMPALRGANALHVDVVHTAADITPQADGLWITDTQGTSTGSFYARPAAEQRMAFASDAAFASVMAVDGAAPAADVPEPASLALVGAALLGLSMVRGRRRRAAGG